MLQAAARIASSLNFQNVLQRLFHSTQVFFGGPLEHLCSVGDGIPVPGNVPCWFPNTDIISVCNIYERKITGSFLTKELLCQTLLMRDNTSCSIIFTDISSRCFGAGNCLSCT